MQWRLLGPRKDIPGKPGVSSKYCANVHFLVFIIAWVSCKILTFVTTGWQFGNSLCCVSNFFVSLNLLQNTNLFLKKGKEKKKGLFHLPLVSRVTFPMKRLLWVLALQISFTGSILYNLQHHWYYPVEIQMDQIEGRRWIKKSHWHWGKRSYRELQNSKQWTPPSQFIDSFPLPRQTSLSKTEALWLESKTNTPDSDLGFVENEVPTNFQY